MSAMANGPCRGRYLHGQLIWRGLRWWMSLPRFKGRDRVFFEIAPRLAPPRSDLLVLTRSGFRLKLDLGDEIDAQIFLFGWYEPCTCAALGALLAPGDHAIDVGANIGYLSLAMATMVGSRGTVHAFEPSPTTCARLARNVSLNPYLRVRVLAAALGDGSQNRLRLGQRDAHRSGDASLVRDGDRVDPSWRIHDVELLSIDRYCMEHDVVPTVIKVDAEGWDTDVLAGAQETLRRFQPALLVEFNSVALKTRGHSAAQLLEVLHGAGYEVFRISPIDVPPVLDADLTETFNEEVLAIVATKHGPQLGRVREKRRELGHPFRGEVWPTRTTH